MKKNIAFNGEILNDFSKAAALEWIETNGLGGYASATVTGANTRRYHGLLVSTGEALSRFVLLSKLEDSLIVLGRRYDLSCNQYHETIHPGGHLLLSGFERYPFPTFYYDLEGVRLKKEIFMAHGEETTVIIYSLLTPGVGKLLIRPLLAFRDYHSLTRENPAFDPTAIVKPNRVSLHPYPGMPTIVFHSERGSFSGPPYWYRDFRYRCETDRGLDDSEDLLSPGELSLTLTHYRPAALVVTSGEKEPEPALKIRDQEIQRRHRLLSRVPERDRTVDALVLAADQFLIRDKTGRSTVIAGYPWFTDWGRDTMISLEGLALCTGHHGRAREVLIDYGKRLQDGLVPNRTVEGSIHSEYHSVDTSLLFVQAVDRYITTTKDAALLKTLFPVLERIIEAYRKGTRFGIKMDGTDGLLYAGEPGLQLTWMDAKVGNWVVTPRQGKAVEINALWHHALYRMSIWSEALSVRRDYGKLAARVHFQFNRRFWYEPGNYLYDVIDTDGGPDQAFRPNQIMAVSLDPALLNGQRAILVMKQVREKLLTPMGLRTLAPQDSAYRKHYEGSPWERDSAYHQGTVWPWWIGPYVDACLKVMPEELDGGILNRLINQLRHYGIGTIGEIFDGNWPHKPVGCPAQAWSVAEVLRSYINLKSHLRNRQAQKRPCNRSEFKLK
jgi:predicted glycogen debranching enzyme